MEPPEKIPTYRVSRIQTGRRLEKKRQSSPSGIEYGGTDQDNFYPIWKSFKFKFSVKLANLNLTPHPRDTFKRITQNQ